MSAAQARALLNTVRPRDIVARTRRQLAAELITEVTVIDKKIKAANAQLTELVESTGSRFANRDHLASWNGTAPSMRPPETSGVTGSIGFPSVSNRCVVPRAK